MKYPAKYVILRPDELPAQTGAGALELFDKVIGDTFKSQFLNSIRVMAWNCLQQKSLQPTVDWVKEFSNMFVLNKLTFLYGGFRVGQTFMDYWKK